MARRDVDGYIHLSDRKSNLIISGGENIYPSEIESLVGAHPLVKDVAVIGLPDDKWGERVHAVIVLHEGAALNERDLADWSKERMAGFKRPRSYSFIAESEMPRNATGKVLHRELKKKFTS
jgi:acyl-CoA synthetase (AMP-forming)/AMP-acid ligase II